MYRRISKGLFNYALYPDNTDYRSIIKANNPELDYYDSIYLYNDADYSRFIAGLKEAAQYAEVSFREDDLLGVEGRVRSKLSYLKNKQSDETAGKLLSKYSVGGTTDIKTNRIVFDFDSETNIDEARKDALEVCSRLLTNGVEQDAISVCFSGGKGFSVEVKLNEMLTRKEFERIVFNLSKNLKTFDHKVKDEQRLFRIPLTKHPKSGLFKIPLTIEELSDLSINDIKIRASKESILQDGRKMLEFLNSKPQIKLPAAIKTYSIKEEKPEMDEDSFKFDDRLDLSRKPSWMSATKFALQEGFFENGNRNDAFMILCATYKTYGFPKEIAYRMLKGVAELQAKRTGGDLYNKKNLWSQVINSVYSDNWRGGTYSEKENDLLKKTAERFGLSQDNSKARLTTLEEGLTRFKTFGENYEKNKITFGIPQLDKSLLITTQMTVGILGAPSSGKTTVAMKMIDGVLASDENVLFHSLDMGEYNIISRFLSKHSNYGYREILEKIHSGQLDKKLLNAWDIVRDKYKNLGVTYRSGTTVDDIEQDIIDFSNQSGKRPKLVVVDYLEKVRGPYSDDTANTGYVASRLSDLATEYDTTMVILLQPQKHAGDPSEPLYSMRKIKGSSKIEQDCRVVLTVWRPLFDPEDNSHDKYMQMAVVKNNMGGNDNFLFGFDGKSGSILELNHGEIDYFQELLKEFEGKKAEKRAQQKLDF